MLIKESYNTNCDRNTVKKQLTKTLSTLVGGHDLDWYASLGR